MKQKAMAEKVRPLSIGALVMAVVAATVLPLGVGAQPGGRQVLRGHVPLAVTRLSAVGNLPGTNRLHLAIGLPLRHQAELN